MYSDPPSPIKKSDSNTNINSKNNTSSDDLDVDVDKIVQQATGGKPKSSSTAANKAATETALWVPDNTSIALVLGSIFAICGGYFWWNWFNRRRW